MPAWLKSEVVAPKIVTNGTLVLRMTALPSAPLGRGTDATREQVLV